MSKIAATQNISEPMNTYALALLKELPQHQQILMDGYSQWDRQGSDAELFAYYLSEEFIPEADFFSATAKIYGLPYVDKLPLQNLAPHLVKDLSMTFCMQNGLAPLWMDGSTLVVGVTSPFLLQKVDSFRLLFPEYQLKQVLCPKHVFESAITSMFERLDLSDQSKGLVAGDEEGIEGLDVAQDLLMDTEEAPVRREVTTIIRRGIIERASDIHIEPYEDRVSVRFRIDGRLREVRVIPKKYQSSVATRIKILSRLNIAESRLPQDGRITLKVGVRDIDVRVSTLPIKYGERIVLRILDKSSGIPEIHKIGMPKEVLHNFTELVKQKHGIVLVTGPTGSGKTTTLASALMSINKPDVSIITVEDPVEIQIPGASQVEVNERAGLTFAHALRSILRQNPNIILIGEIRDSETAHIAVQASITGHLVFSTLHTNDTASSVTRLVDFGIEPFQITTAVLGILAVRLLRRLCMHCREPTKYTLEELKAIGIGAQDAKNHTFYSANPNGCPLCKGTGYSGRIGIYELLIFDDFVRSFVLKSSDGASLKRACVHRGMKTLRDSAVERFLNGETTLEEALYATQNETEKELEEIS